MCYFRRKLNSTFVISTMIKLIIIICAIQVVDITSNVVEYYFNNLWHVVLLMSFRNYCCFVSLFFSFSIFLFPSHFTSPWQLNAWWWLPNSITSIMSSVVNLAVDELKKSSIFIYHHQNIYIWKSSFWNDLPLVIENSLFPDTTIVISLIYLCLCII